jgi:hypothetical protein
MTQLPVAWSTAHPFELDQGIRSTTHELNLFKNLPPFFQVRQLRHSLSSVSATHPRPSLTSCILNLLYDILRIDGSVHDDFLVSPDIFHGCLVWDV